MRREVGVRNFYDWRGRRKIRGHWVGGLHVGNGGGPGSNGIRGESRSWRCRGAGRSSNGAGRKEESRRIQHETSMN